MSLTHYYTGKPCKYGHISERLYSDRSCTRCNVERARRQRLNNIERIRETGKRWYRNNLDKAKAKARRQHARAKMLNPEKYKRVTRSKALKWQKENPEKANARNARRRANKLKRTPPWLTPEQHQQIQEFYTTAQRLTKETGIDHHVDHIFPLNGKTVSGLHVPWNLRVVTATENLSKSNRLPTSKEI